MPRFSTSSNYITQPIPVWRIGQLECCVKVSKRRRTIGFKVQHGFITLQVPYGLAKDILTAMVLEREEWLAAKQAEQLAAPKPPQRKLESGALWPLRGKQLELVLKTSKHHQITPTATQLMMTITSRQVSKACQWRLLENWYKTEALALAKAKVAYWQQAMGTDLKNCPSLIQVRRFRSQWGSCSSNGELKFNWPLVMAPEYVFDYVVVHEMCHLRFMHHGRQFWQMVSDYCPDYVEAKQWLKLHGHSLLIKPDLP